VAQLATALDQVLYARPELETYLLVIKNKQIGSSSFKG